MKDVLDNKIWAVLFRLLLVMAPIACSAASAVFIHLYGTLTQHGKQLENLSEWRRSHMEFSESAVRKLEILDRTTQDRQLDLVVLRENVKATQDTANRTAVNLGIISEQISRLETAATETRERLSHLQKSADRAAK